MDIPKKLLVCLDMTDLDKYLLQYVAYLCDAFPVKDIILIHNILLEKPPKELQDLYPETSKPVEKLVKEEINEDINKYLNGSRAEIRIKIFQNQGVNDIVKWVNDHNVDLCILGNKTEKEGQGIFSIRFLRLTGHPVMLVPSSAKYPIKEIIAPLDFSKSAVPVIKSAHQLSKLFSSELKYLHLYTLPPQYFPYLPRNMDKYRQGYLDYGEKTFKKLKEKAIGKEETGECHYKLVEKEDIAGEVHHWAQYYNAGLIVLGAKGKSDAEVLLLGSVTEKLTTISKDIPLLIVKMKAHSNWLESFLER